jgi:adenosylhomocysteine nucleosidase
MRTLIPVLCTSGLAAEAKVARAAGFQVIVGAGDPERTTALVEAAIRQAKCLISFGIAGGLAPHLRAGDVVLSAEVIGQDRSWRSNEMFRKAISDLARQIGAAEGPVLGATEILATEDDKARAWRATGALAVDMESAIVARAAEAAGIPFVVLRTIADAATRELPSAALIPLSEDGRPVLTRVLGDMLRRPRQIAALCGLARETRQALVALSGPAHSLRGAIFAT